MRIGLLDVDGHNFPNLALMKLSAYHKKIGDEVEFVNFLQPYDRVYKSKVFTFTPDEYTHIMCDDIKKGGSGYNVTTELPEEIEHILPDYSLYNSEHAYGFLTRGCIRKCSWCLVPRKEGMIRKGSSIDEFIGDKKTAVLMDNNVLASEEGINGIERIVEMGVKVDFNQALDARLIDRSIAKLLAKVKWLNPIRMSCDTLSMLPIVEKATKLLREEGATPKAYMIYVLVQDIPSALDRVQRLRKLKLDPFAMAFIDFNDGFKVCDEHKRFARWVNHKAIFKTVSWEDYRA